MSRTGRARPAVEDAEVERTGQTRHGRVLYFIIIVGEEGGYLCTKLRRCAKSQTRTSHLILRQAAAPRGHDHK